MSQATQSLVGFLPLLRGQKEFGVIVASDEAEREAYAQGLESQGFRFAPSPKYLAASLRSPGSNCVSFAELESSVAKELYDLACQYPTGQVTGFDTTSMTPYAVNPAYAESSVLLVLTEAQLDEFASHDLPLLSACGLVYRRR